jgi:hypothetical protein
MSALPPKADIQTGVIDHGSVVLRLIARACHKLSSHCPPLWNFRGDYVLPWTKSDRAGGQCFMNRPFFMASQYMADPRGTLAIHPPPEEFSILEFG